MKSLSNLLGSKCVCPVCWLAVGVATIALILQIYHPSNPSAQIADWLKYYVLVGTLFTAVWIAATAPTVLRKAREIGAKEPAALLIGFLLFGGAPVILLPLMVSAWPLLGLCAICRWRRERVQAVQSS